MKSGCTALHHAAQRGHHLVMVRLLRAGSEADGRNNEGSTPLHTAAQNGHQLAVEILLEHNCELDIRDAKARTALHIAASLGHIAVVETLLQFRASLHVKDKHSNCPLHLAVLGCHPNMVDLLVKKGASVNATNSRLQTPLHIAAELGFTEVVEVLVSRGADLFMPEKGGRTALYIAARGSYTAIVDMLITAEREMKHKSHANDVTSITLQGSRQFCNSLVDIKEESSSTAVEQDEAQRLQKLQQMQRLAWTLAKDLLAPPDWKLLARQWGFTAEHIKAIEHQYTGKYSYKEHGYRMMLIWLHGLPLSANPLKELFEALVAIDKRDVAEKIRKKAEDQQYSTRRFNPGQLCHMCCIL